MYYPHYDPLFTGAYPLAGVHPDGKKLGNSIKREKRIKQKMSDGMEANESSPGLSPNRGGINESHISGSKYVYPNLTKSPKKGTDGSSIYRPWSGYPYNHGAHPWNYAHYGYPYYGYGHGYGYGYGYYGYGYGNVNGYSHRYGYHPWFNVNPMYMMGKKNWRAMQQPPEPVDPIYKYLDPISVSL